MNLQLQNFIKSFENRWPSDHPIVYDLTNSIMTWNIEAPKQTGKIAFEHKPTQIKYFETNLAFSYRNDIILNILSNFCSIANFSIIFLQEVDTEVILNIIANNFLYDNYKILFRTDPDKPKGLAVLIKNYSILSIDKETVIGTRSINSNSMKSIKYDYKGNTYYLESILSQFPNSIHLDSIFSQTVSEDGIVIGKVEALKMILINNSNKIRSLHICVHLNPKTTYGTNYSNLYSDEDKIVYIVGDFNKTHTFLPNKAGNLSSLSINIDHIFIKDNRRIKINQNSVQIGESYIYSLESYRSEERTGFSSRFSRDSIVSGRGSSDGNWRHSSGRNSSYSNLRSSSRGDSRSDFDKLLHKLLLGDSTNNKELEISQIFETDGYRWSLFLFRLNLLKDFKSTFKIDTETEILFEKVNTKTSNLEELKRLIEISDRYIPISKVYDIIYSSPIRMADFRLKNDIYNLDRKEVSYGKGSYTRYLLKLLEDIFNTLKVRGNKELLITMYQKYYVFDKFYKKHSNNSIQRFFSDVYKNDLIESEEVNIGENKFKVNSIDGDGNCLFNSIIRSVGERIQISASELRTMVARRLRELITEPEYLSKIDAQLKLDWNGYNHSNDNANDHTLKYINQYIEVDPVVTNVDPRLSYLYWGGNIELQVITDLLNLKINLLNLDGSTVELLPSDVNEETKTIYIRYNGIHYDSLSLLQGEIAKGGSYKINYTNF